MYALTLCNATMLGDDISSSKSETGATASSKREEQNHVLLAAKRFFPQSLDLWCL
jgi:hypothetical protein